MTVLKNSFTSGIAITRSSARLSLILPPEALVVAFFEPALAADFGEDLAVPELAFAFVEDESAAQAMCDIDKKIATAAVRDVSNFLFLMVLLNSLTV